MRRRSRREVYDDRTASRVVMRSTAKRASQPGALWGYVFGATIAATVYTYSKTFPTAASREALASFSTNAAWAALFGPLSRLDTVAGYTAYKTGMFITILGAIWGLLIATKLTRGEEDAGRWELLLAGRTTRSGAARQAAIGLGAGIVALWVPTALIAAVGGALSTTGISIGALVFFATAAVAAAAMFTAIGMLVAQLAPTRHDANLTGAAILAGSYLIRMMADSDASLSWLRWLSPLGWIEQLRPLTGSHWFAFVPIVVLLVVLVGVSVRIAGTRDLGTSAFAVRDEPPSRTLLLGGQAGLTLRLARPAIAAWVAALAATGFVFGLVAQTAGTALQGSPTLDRVISRLGGTASGAVSYLGFVFVVAAGLVAIAVAGQVASTRNEEASGHLDNLLVRSVARWRWLGVRLLVGLGLVVAAGLFAGLAAWIGAATQHADVGIDQLVKAGLNVVPPAVFVLGIGGLAFGVWPRGAIGVAYGLVVWSFLIETVAAVVNSNHWLLDTSPLTHMAPVPASNPNWTAALWLVGLGLLASLAGLAAFGRRDVVEA
jgi:ABC-2 type transport system permease protein